MESNTIELELRVQKRKRKDKLVLNAWCWLFMAAAVIFYILFQGYPTVSYTHLTLPTKRIV